MERARSVVYVAAAVQPTCARRLRTRDRGDDSRPGRPGGVDFVVTTKEVIGDPHQVLDDEDHLLEGEDDGAVRTPGSHRLPVRARGLGLELLDVFNSKGTHTWCDLDRRDAPGTDRADEGTGAKPRLTDRVTRCQHAPGNELAPGERTTPGTNHVRLADIADQRADLTRRHPETVRLDDRRIPYEACDVVVNARPLVLLLSLDEVPAGDFEFRCHCLTISP